MRQLILLKTKERQITEDDLKDTETIQSTDSKIKEIEEITQRRKRKYWKCNGKPPVMVLSEVNLQR